MKPKGWTHSPLPHPDVPASCREVWFHRPGWSLQVAHRYVRLQRTEGIATTVLQIALPCPVAAELLTVYGAAHDVPGLAECLAFAGAP